MNPLLKLKKELEQIDAKESELRAERSKVQKEIASYTPERIINEGCAETWDGKEAIKGRLIYVDRQNWFALLRQTTWDYVLISVGALKETNVECALKLANLFSTNQFPRGIASHGTLTIQTDGSIEDNKSESISALDQSQRVTA